eukprot:Protomagalhaensia_wolfi_Nauph_80__4836@NODE_5054_length_453_cov_13_700483_g4119_i0_p1_GENE_NODE_5054_length_453_cov_13_700483_g4119_i0NODE_5054_length_453_cov_13_700483_g4119_i0_p1_ORF_typecomplete_len121_score9_79_NODE_5054_length_453_cov_13_700483_g4119_i03365
MMKRQKARDRIEAAQDDRQNRDNRHRWPSALKAGDHIAIPYRGSDKFMPLSGKFQIHNIEPNSRRNRQAMSGFHHRFFISSILHPHRHLLASADSSTFVCSKLRFFKEGSVSRLRASLCP